MPEIVDALRAAEETGAEDYIGAAIEDGFEELAVVARIIFEVGVLDEDDVSGDFGKATAEGCTFALILHLEKDAEVAEGDGVGAIHGGGVDFAGVFPVEDYFEELAQDVD